VAEVEKKMQGLGLKQLATEFNNSLPEPRNQIVKIQIHRSISLMMMIKEIVMMMTLNLMSSHNPWQLRCFFYPLSTEWGIAF
jgi:hypothetical protein